MATALRPIYTAAASAEAASAALDAFERGPWGTKFPTVVASWRRAWTQIIPFFAFPPDVRRLIYTTNALESVHAQLRKIIKTRGHCPNDDAATKLIWLALRNITMKWERVKCNGAWTLRSREPYSVRQRSEPYSVLSTLRTLQAFSHPE